MAEDWAADVRRHAPNADEAVISAIVRYCGIALRNRDSSLVSFSDPTETERVRENFCRKKLGLTEPDAAIDAAIARVGERMGGDPSKNRVTVYYLLAEAFGKLGLFGAAAASEAEVVAAPAAAAANAPMTGPPPAVSPGANTAAAAAATGPAAGQAPHLAAARDDRTGMGGTVLAGCGVLAAIIIGTAALATLVATRPDDAPVVIPAAPAAQVAAVAPVAPIPQAAPPAGPAVAIPEGSGVVAQVLEGKPAVSVYFDTAKADVSPDFATIAAPVKAWIDGHPGARVAVSGFNDPRGNAAFNAELSKNRAKSVRAALTALGLPADVIDLKKPPETTDASTSPAQARRVDIVISDAS